MKIVFRVASIIILIPFLPAQPVDINDGGTTEEGGNDGASGNGFIPLVLGDLPGLNYSLSLADEAFTLKNTSEHPSPIVITIQTESSLTTTRSLWLKPDQEVDVDPPKTSSPVETIRVLSMLPFEVGLKEVVPVIGASIETILHAQAPTESFDLNFVEDASGQVIPVGVMEDGSVHYPLFGKRIGMIENDAVLIDGTQQRFELLE